MGRIVMAFMTYLIRRGATWHFRFRLPDDLRGKVAPNRIPDHLGKLVNRKAGSFKHEITESLRTSDNSIARARVGVLISDSEFLVRDARRFLTEGAPRTLSPEVVEYLATRRVHELLAHDDALRVKGLGLDLRPMRHAALAGLTIGGSPPETIAVTGVAAKPQGMTVDDWELLSFATDRGNDQLKVGVAFGRAPDWVQQALAEALADRGILIDPDSAEWRELERAFLGATQQAFQAMQSRNSGIFTPTPSKPLDPAEKLGPHLSEAFAAWKTGALVPGAKVPAANSAAEAEYAVRRFRELYGDVRIGAITREQARGFRDSLWRLPTRLPETIERLRLPDILARSDLGRFPRRAPGTLGKHITLISSIVEKAARAHDLAFKGTGWATPFNGLRPEVQSERERQSFQPDELEALFGSPIYATGARPRGGAGEASFWLPLLGLLTGARLGELCQLRLCDVKLNGQAGLYLDIGTSGGRTVKTATSRRRIPLHPALMEIGFPAYLAVRRSETRIEDDLLFSGLAVRGGRAPGAQWSKWFSRWRTEHLKLASGEERKDFHSFRHTFKDMCREAAIEEEVHDALTGHAGGGVGRRYGNAGVPLAVLTEAVTRIKVPDVVARLRWTTIIDKP